MNNSTNRPASARQIWALYCITKHDYRNDGLSFDEASNLIKKLGSNDYKKKTTKTCMREQFIEYYKKHILPEIIGSLNCAIGIESEVVKDTNFMKCSGENGTPKRYKMRGFGCSISYLDYDKRSKKAQELEKIFRDLRFTIFKDLVIEQFDKKIINQLDNEGTPIGALYCQDYDVNSTLYNGVVQFAKEVLKINSRFDYVTRLD